MKAKWNKTKNAFQTCLIHKTLWIKITFWLFRFHLHSIFHHINSLLLFRTCRLGLLMCWTVFFFFFFLCPRSAHFTKHPSDSLCNRCGRFRLQYLFGFFFQFGSRYLLVNELVRDSVLWRAHTHTHTIKMSNLFKWLVFRAMIINLEHFVVSKWTAHFSRKRVDNETTLRTKQQKNCGNHRNGNFIGFF